MVRTVRLGGTAKHIEVVNVSHGLMRMTWVPTPVPDEQAFKAIKDGVDAANGSKVFLNSGAFYSQDFGPANLELLARFYDKYPDYKEKTVLCVKGIATAPTAGLEAHEKTIRNSVDVALKALRGTKHLDVYENARVDPNIPIEESIGILKKLVQEGKFDHIGMSECGAQTLRRANAVHPIAHVEIEVSPFCYEEDTRKVISTAEELKIPVLAYSPQGSGFLTGAFRSLDDFPADDFRRHFDRFQPENFHHNIKLVDRLTEIANNKGITPGQLSIAWVASLGPHMLPLPGSSHSKRTLENLAAGDIVLSQEEVEDIKQILDSMGVKGERYAKGTKNLMA
ncbi:NADP-dependent oxidoreductase domain-containing protein [Gautieria morchelliformis]|nr:NADP-dependent oxidoreductase domain-containing protein [Gautieria morchelliformis]